MISAEFYLTELSKTNTVSRSSSNICYKTKPIANSTNTTFYKTKKTNVSFRTTNKINNYFNDTKNNFHNSKYNIYIKKPFLSKRKIHLKYRNQSMKNVITNITKQNKTAYKFQESLLDYLVQEKTNFADFNSIENYYNKKLIDNYQKYNINNILIKNKKQHLSILIQEITQTVVSVYNPIENNELSIYENKINNLKRQIQIKEIELASYKHIYNRSYKTNYLLSKRYEDELIYQQIQNNQYSKYKILKQHALSSITKQKEMLKNMHEFQELSEMTYINQLSNKMNLFNKLDFEVVMIKKDTINIENEIYNDKSQQNKIKTLIYQQQELNSKIYRYYMWSMKDYYSMKMKLLNLYMKLKVNNLFNVIKKLNVLKKENDLLHFRFEKVNYDIAKLNLELTEMNQEIESIKEQIELKQSTKVKSQDDLRLDVFNKVKTQQYLNDLYESNFKSKENLLRVMINFLYNYKLKILRSFQASIIPDSYMVKYYLQQYQNNLHILTNNDNREKQIQKFQILYNTLDNKKLFIFVFNLFNLFINDIFTLLSNVYNYVSLTHTETIQQDINDNINYQIILFKSPSFTSTFQQQLVLAINRQNDKTKILNRSEKEIFHFKHKQISLKQNPEELINKNTITSNKLFQKYLKYAILNKRLTYNDNKYMQIHPKRCVSLLEKYTNGLVSDKLEQEKLHQERKANIINKSALILNKQKSLELKRLMRLKKENINKIYQDEDQFDLDEEEYKNKVKIEYEKLNEELKKRQQKIKYTLNTPNNEMNIIYKRLDDLRNLELKYYNEKDVINNKEMNEMYYNFKKKYYSKRRKRNYNGNYSMIITSKKCLSRERKENNENRKILHYCSKEKEMKKGKYNNKKSKSYDLSEIKLNNKS